MLLSTRSGEQCSSDRKKIRHVGELIEMCDGKDGSMYECFRSLTVTDSLFVGISSAVSLHGVITFCVSRRRCKMYCGHARLCVCVCLSSAACPHYCTDPDVTWGSGRGCPPSCALLGGFAIGARVALLWQHANPSYKLASVP